MAEPQLSYTYQEREEKEPENFILLKLGKLSFQASAASLSEKSELMKDIVEQKESQAMKVVLELPLEYVKADALKMLLDSLNKRIPLPDRLNAYLSLEICKICSLLGLFGLEIELLTLHVKSNLNKNNVSSYLQQAFRIHTAKQRKLREAFDDAMVQEESSFKTSCKEWSEFVSYCVNFAALNISHLVDTQKSDLVQNLEKGLLFEIIDRAIYYFNTDSHFNNTQLLNLLIELRECENIFQLLEQEEKRLLETHQDILKMPSYEPYIQWGLNSLSKNFYKESGSFDVEGMQWKLAASYFQSQEDALKLSIKLNQNPFDYKQSRDYFKRKDFFLPSTTHQQPGQVSEDQEDKETQHIVPSHSFITIVTALKLNHADHAHQEYTQWSDLKVINLISASKAPSALTHYPGLKLDQMDNAFDVSLYLSVSYTHSAILNYISKNFGSLYTLKDLHLLNKDHLKQILKHKYLNVSSEEEVIYFLCNWATQKLDYSKKSCFILEENLDLDISELVENVNWNYVPLPVIMEILREHTLIRKNLNFQKRLKKEFEFRTNFNPELSQCDQPRQSYKFSHTQLTLQVQDKKKEGNFFTILDHTNFQKQLFEALLNPQNQIESSVFHMIPDLSNHQMHLLVLHKKKKRELEELEMQLQNLNLLEMVQSQPLETLEEEQKGQQQQK